MIFMAGCTAPPTDQTSQDPNIAPEGVRITADVVYGHKFGMALTFDMIQPSNQNGAGVIFINSGGWVSPILSFLRETAEGLRLVTLEELKKTEFEAIAGEPMEVDMSGFNIEPLLSKGFTVFDLRHGSSPKFEMNEIVSDLRRAVRFIRHNSAEFGIDANRLGAWGGSAGGHLSLMLGTTAEIGNAEAVDEFEKSTGRLAAVAAYFPVSNLEKLITEARKNDPNSLTQFPAADIESGLLRDLSPINFVSPDDPPTLIVHGDKDLLVPLSEGESMHQALMKAEVESKLVIIPDAGHGFAGEDADQAAAEVLNWFEEHLAQPSSTGLKN
jgi:acetyl esterase/lipase